MPTTEELQKPAAAFRLSVGDEEIELVTGEKLIGRAPECDIVIDDPLVSRQHARLTCDGVEVFLEDLGSRNGSRINGAQLRGQTLLENGDRVQIGAREFVFSQDSAYSQMRIPLARRGLAKARESSDIPGDLESGPWSIEEEITLVAWVDPGREEGSVRWPLDMLVELLGRAMLSGRQRDVTGIMEQAVISMNRALDALELGAGEPIKVGQLDALRDAAKWLAKVQKSDRWLHWIKDAYSRAGYSGGGVGTELIASTTTTLAPKAGRASHAEKPKAARAWKGRPSRD